MKKIIILGFISFFSTMVMAQVLTFETAGNVELCDDCSDSDASMPCLKCNVCKGQYGDFFIWLWRYETKRLGEMRGLSEYEKRQQMISLKAYINTEIKRIKNSIQFCVQSEMRQVEIEIRRTTEAAIKMQEPATYTPRSVTEGVAMGITSGIAQAGDHAANGLKGRNEENYATGDYWGTVRGQWEGREAAAKAKINALKNEAGNLASETPENVNLRDRLNKQMAKSEKEDSENEQLQKRKEELEKKLKEAVDNAAKKCPECADAASNK